MKFRDMLYGEIELPGWLSPFLRIPEFVRLRGVQLSNVDSIQYKDFSGPSRWAHSIAVAYLATRYSNKRGLGKKDEMELVLAALLHDVASPPFAHTIEFVIEDYDHEIEAQRLLTSITTKNSIPDIPIFESQIPQFYEVCTNLSKETKINVDPSEVARLIVGDSEHGFLINGTIDFDNADNVTRACMYLGIDVDKNLPIKIVDWLADQNSPPVGIELLDINPIKTWLGYRKELYSNFYNASDDEIGREAFLQHIIRHGLKFGLSRSSIIWNTDDSLLNALENVQSNPNNRGYNLKALVEKYRLLAPVHLIGSINLDDENQYRILQSALVTRWIESHISSAKFRPIIIVKGVRHKFEDLTGSILPSSFGMLRIYALTKVIKFDQLPNWMRKRIENRSGGKLIKHAITAEIRNQIPAWIKSKPWLKATPKIKRNVVENLNSVGDWSFRLSRNESLHPYPSTFVHTIPACFINALGLKGELVMDPFGGTGQVAVEAIKYGGKAISNDLNSFATQIARTKLTYLSREDRHFLRLITKTQIEKFNGSQWPEDVSIEKWHHPRTLEELAKIADFQRSQDNIAISQLLKTALSAILPSTTARIGLQHGFFADNTPLPKDLSSPPYQNAMDLFTGRIKKNINIIERLYSFMERNGADPSKELKNAQIVQNDFRNLSPETLNIKPNSVSGIITSPPYLGMADYTLGHRLSYYWMGLEEMGEQLQVEMGARRHRFNSAAALSKYYKDFEIFSVIISKILRVGGHLAMVLGKPVAKAFKDEDILETIDKLLSDQGIEKIWTKWRPISWHRNYGYQKLMSERLSVYVLKK